MRRKTLLLVAAVLAGEESFLTVQFKQVQKHFHFVSRAAKEAPVFLDLAELDHKYDVAWYTSAQVLQILLECRSDLSKQRVAELMEEFYVQIPEMRPQKSVKKSKEVPEQAAAAGSGSGGNSSSSTSSSSTSSAGVMSSLISKAAKFSSRKG